MNLSNFETPKRFKSDVVEFQGGIYKLLSIPVYYILMADIIPIGYSSLTYCFVVELFIYMYICISCIHLFLHIPDGKGF